MNSSVVCSHSTACMYEATHLFYKMGKFKKKNITKKQKRKTKTKKREKKSKPKNRWSVVHLQRHIFLYSFTKIFFKKATEMHKMCVSGCMDYIYICIWGWQVIFNLASKKTPHMALLTVHVDVVKMDWVSDNLRFHFSDDTLAIILQLLKKKKKGNKQHSSKDTMCEM